MSAVRRGAEEVGEGSHPVQRCSARSKRWIKLDKGHRQRACSGYGRDGERDRYRPYQGQGGRAESDDSEDEWSARSKKRRRQSSASIAGRASKRSSVHQLDAADPSPSSSPFRAVRPAWKKHSRTAGGAKKYGSKRGRGTDSATPEDDADHRPTRRVRGPGLGTGEERAGVEEWTAHLREYARPNSSSASISSSSAPPLSSESIHRTTAVLRAYTNILDSIVDSSSSPSSAFHLSSLAESSARDVGWAIEENVRGWLVENGMVSPEPSSDSSSEHGSSGSDDSDGESPGPTSVGMDRAEGVSAQEAEMQASRLVDEWYEACPTYTWRWILAEHATSILVTELQDADAPYGIWETVLGVCVERGAFSEAARLHRPLVQSAFALPLTTAASTANILDVLRLTPSPHALLHTALLPTLLSSAFEDRFFFHSFLVLSPSKLGAASEVAIEVLSVLSDVAMKMVSTLQELRDEEEDDEENEGLAEMVDEVLARIVKQVKAALPLLLEFPPDSHVSYEQTRFERWQRLSRLERLSEMAHAVLHAAKNRLADEDADGPASELVALALVAELEAVTLREVNLRSSRHNLERLDRLLALPPAVTLRSPSSPNPTSDHDSSDDAESCLLVDYLSSYYLSSRTRKTKVVNWHTSRTIDDIAFLVQEFLCVSNMTDMRQRRRDDFARCIMLACRRRRLLDNTEVRVVEGWLVKLDGRRARKERPRQSSKSPSVEEERLAAGLSTDYEETPAPSAPPKRLRKQTSRGTSPRHRDRTIRSSSIELDDDSADAESDIEIVEPAFSLSRPARQIERTGSTASSASSRIAARECSAGSVSKRQQAAHVKPVEIVVLEPSPSPDLPSPSAPMPRSTTSSTASFDQQSRLKPPRSRSPDPTATPTSSEPDDLDLLRSARRRPSKRPPPVRDNRALAPAAPKPRSAGKAPPSPSPSPPVDKRRRVEASDRAASTHTTRSSRTGADWHRATAQEVAIKRRRVLVEESSEDELAL
ncbi:hypothetical protein BJY59DRAFT_709123 [Rhodotorula toruloides]